MEPVEVNAGAWYLRALRDDERVDDRPRLRLAGRDDPAYVRVRAAQWAADAHYSWAVCEPTTGELLGEVGLTPLEPGEALLSGWSLPGHEAALATGMDAVRRFTEGFLELRVR